MRRLISAIVVCLLAATAAFAAAAAELGTRKSSDHGVTVTVTPKNVASDAKTWDFTVVLDTHSADLNDDLAKSALLFDGAGGQLAPIAWDGAPPGGHHREGVLRFKPVSPQPLAIELQIARPGESKPRTFRWQLQ